MLLKKEQKRKKCVVFTDWSEPNCDLLNANFVSSSLMSRLFWLYVQWVLRIYIQNLTRCFSWIQNVTQFLFSIQNRTHFKIFVLISCFLNCRFRFCWSFIKVLPSSRNNLLERDNGLGWNGFFERLACVCLPFGTILLVIAFFLAFGFLMGVMTISFWLPIDL